MTSKQKGNWGLASAIEYFASKGFAISIPLTDTQRYDLIVEFPEGLKKIQVKTSHSQSKSGAWNVSLRNTSIRKKSPTVIKLFDKSEFDFVFVLTGAGNKYLIPSSAIQNTTQINVGNNYAEHKV